MMKLILPLLAIASLAAAVACSDGDVAPVDPTTTTTTTTTTVATQAVVIPEYVPLGDDAALKKEGAAGIDEKNAPTKVAELEGNLDARIAELGSKHK